MTYFKEVFNRSVFRHKPLVGGLGDGTLVGDKPVDGALPPFERPRWPLLNGLDQTAYSSHTLDLQTSTVLIDLIFHSDSLHPFVTMTRVLDSFLFFLIADGLQLCAPES